MIGEFKFGDLATVTKLNKRVVVMADQGDSDSVHISEGEGHKTHYMPADELTLISRHQQWVKFDEDDEATLPAAGDAYCTYCPHGATEEFNGVGVLFLDADSDGDEGDLLWISDGGATLELSDITHWMALPDPPKEQL